jgi:hypothetical protein
MQYDFVINTENVNEYKYRILTDGIDYTQYLRNPVVLYLHERDSFKNKGGEVIGRCIKLFVQDKKLIATIEFDENDEFSKRIADKVAGGFIRMASMYADVIAASSEPELVIEGQLYETVTKCKLVEISIVPIGGNDDALKLSKKGGEVKLNKLNIKKEDMELKTIALALGKPADTSENVLLDTIAQVKLEASNSKTKVAELEAEIKTIRLSGATALVDKAVQLGLIPATLKDSQVKAFESDFDGQTAILSKLIEDKEAENVGSGNQTSVKEVILKGKETSGVVITAPEESFDYLQRHDAVKLSKIRDEEPAKYAQLAKDYQAGVRYAASK